MAESKSSNRSSSGNARRSSSAAKSSQLSAKEAIQQVRQDLPGLLGRPVESILGVERDDDGNWQVMVQVVELARIPNSTDVLGAYVVSLEPGGELAGYMRRRRYQRGQADED